MMDGKGQRFHCPAFLLAFSQQGFPPQLLSRRIGIEKKYIFYWGPSDPEQAIKMLLGYPEGEFLIPGEGCWKSPSKAGSSIESIRK
jgi:hypothetical protein